MGKGSGFEREVCKELSLWWTDQERDDVFWRTAGSGARASVRSKVGRKTFGQHGDIGCTDPIGAPLMDLLLMELKRGYSSHTLQDILDKKRTAAQQTWETWWQQTVESWEASGVYSWLMICRRNQRDALVFMPTHLLQELRGEGCFKKLPRPIIHFSADLKMVWRKKEGKTSKIVRREIRFERISGMRFDDWLSGVTPAQIKSLSRRV